MEEFRDIEGFNGKYQVSNFGRVYSNVGKRKLLTLSSLSNGYISVTLFLNYKRHHEKLHRLIAKAFCDGYVEGLQVNHIDGNKLNNKADNLEWCTCLENIQHYHRNKRK